MSDRALTILLATLAAIAVTAALYATRTIFAPVAFALFFIAVIWPLQRLLLRRLPNLAATSLSVLVTLLVVTALLSLMLWGFGRAGNWLVANGARFQDFYTTLTEWLADHDLYVASLFTEHFNVTWLVRIIQQIMGRFHAMLTFVAITPPRTS